MLNISIYFTKITVVMPIHNLLFTTFLPNLQYSYFIKINRKSPKFPFILFFRNTSISLISKLKLYLKLFWIESNYIDKTYHNIHPVIFPSSILWSQINKKKINKYVAMTTTS